MLAAVVGVFGLAAPPVWLFDAGGGVADDVTRFAGVAVDAAGAGRPGAEVGRPGNAGVVQASFVTHVVGHLAEREEGEPGNAEALEVAGLVDVLVEGRIVDEVEVTRAPRPAVELGLEARVAGVEDGDEAVARAAGAVGAVAVEADGGVVPVHGGAERGDVGQNAGAVLEDRVAHEQDRRVRGGGADRGVGVFLHRDDGGGDGRVHDRLVLDLVDDVGLVGVARGVEGPEVLDEGGVHATAADGDDEVEAVVASHLDERVDGGVFGAGGVAVVGALGVAVDGVEAVVLDRLDGGERGDVAGLGADDGASDERAGVGHEGGPGGVDVGAAAGGLGVAREGEDREQREPQADDLGKAVA